MMKSLNINKHKQAVSKLETNSIIYDFNSKNMSLD